MNLQLGYRFLANATATLGVGHLPKAPGTWGSLLAVLIWWFLFPLSQTVQVLLIVTAFFMGWLATHYYEKWTDKHDPKEVVIDELVGMWLTLLAAPQSGLVFIVGFLLFRLFDIWKPFPIGWVDKKVPGAFGTMIDDVIAAIFAFFVLNLALLSGQFGCGAFGCF